MEKFSVPEKGNLLSDIRESVKVEVKAISSRTKYAVRTFSRWMTPGKPTGLRRKVKVFRGRFAEWWKERSKVGKGFQNTRVRTWAWTKALWSVDKGLVGGGLRRMVGEREAERKGHSRSGIDCLRVCACDIRIEISSLSFSFGNLPMKACNAGESLLPEPTFIRYLPKRDARNLFTRIRIVRSVSISATNPSGVVNAEINYSVQTGLRHGDSYVQLNINFETRSGFTGRPENARGGWFLSGSCRVPAGFLPGSCRVPAWFGTRSPN